MQYKLKHLAQCLAHSEFCVTVGSRIVITLTSRSSIANYFFYNQSMWSFIIVHISKKTMLNL